MSQQEIIQLLGNGGLIVTLVYGLKWLATKFEEASKRALDAQTEMIRVLTTTIQENSKAFNHNSEALAKVEQVVRGCKFQRIARIDGMGEE